MNGDQLRSSQAPVNQRYRAEPEAALIALRLGGRWAQNRPHAPAQANRAASRGGQPEARERTNGGLLGSSSRDYQRGSLASSFSNAGGASGLLNRKPWAA